MTPVHYTSLLVSAELRSNRVGLWGTDVSAIASRTGDRRATQEPSSHRFSLPVVRELPSRPVATSGAW